MADYASVTWTTGDIITETKLDNMVSNDRAENAHEAGMDFLNDSAIRWEDTGTNLETFLKLTTSDDFEVGSAGFDLVFRGFIDGWIPADETWTYASADDPVFTFTVTGDLTAKYKKGVKIKLTQTSDKFFVVVKDSTYSAPDTTVTIYGGTDYDLANAAITSPFYAVPGTSPIGFPTDPTKWSVVVTDTSNRSQATPTQNTWYNLGGIQISVPIGEWIGSWTATLYVARAAAGIVNMGATLSTADNTESDNGTTAYIYGNDIIEYLATLTKNFTLARTSKATYYLNGKTTQTNQTSINFMGSSTWARTVITLRCAYL